MGSFLYCSWGGILNNRPNKREKIVTNRKEKQEEKENTKKKKERNRKRVHKFLPRVATPLRSISQGSRCVAVFYYQN